LNLARSLLKPAHIHIFNQCFDHINPEYIVKIFTKLRREKKTCLFITQNNVVSRHCDAIYVLKKGTLSGTGTHAHLIEKNHDYREICLASAGRIISEEVAKDVHMVTEDATAFIPDDTTGGAAL